MNKTYRLRDLIVFLLLSFECLASPSTGRNTLSGVKGDDVHSCKSQSDPSIDCTDMYPNGTSIDGFKPNSDVSCSPFFFRCHGGISYCINCKLLDDGTQLYYNHARQLCDHRENVATCNSGTIKEENTISLEIDSACPSSSSTPITTINSTETSTITTEELTSTITTTESTITSITPEICCPDVGQYPYPGSCTLYIVCDNDYEPVITSCRIGEVFNPDLGVCDDPENIPGCNIFSIVDYYQGLKNVGKETGRQKCPDVSTGIPDPSTTTISTTSPAFTCPDSGNFEYATCSSFYYVCLGGPGGSYIIAQCPPGEIFDPSPSAQFYCKNPAFVSGCN